MATPTDIYETARELVGTPWLHQGRLKGMGIDCIGLPILVSKSLNLGLPDVANYPRTPDGTMQSRIEEYFSSTSMQSGVLLVFQIRQYPQHCGIVSRYMDGLGLIHAWDVAGQVVEHRLNQQWLDRMVGVYSFPGVQYNG